MGCVQPVLPSLHRASAFDEACFTRFQSILESFAGWISVGSCLRALTEVIVPELRQSFARSSPRANAVALFGSGNRLVETLSCKYNCGSQSFTSCFAAKPNQVHQ